MWMSSPLLGSGFGTEVEVYDWDRHLESDMD